VFFTVSKALAFVTDPWAWACALLCAAVLMRRRPILAASLALAAAGALATFSAPRVADMLQRQVEASALSTFRPDARYDAAIIVAGEASRVVAAAEVAHAGRARFLLYSGALNRVQVGHLSDKLRAMGVPDDRIVVEAASRNTRENAVESARVVAARGWRSLLIVTSAAHVERALGAFRSVGLEPDVLPVDYRAPLSRASGGPSWPSRSALQRTSEAMHELIGRAVYRVMGYAS
jgi:uncharacterized SAM-binding protein YcdF (DUF218 family)